MGSLTTGIVNLIAGSCDLYAGSGDLNVSRKYHYVGRGNLYVWRKYLINMGLFAQWRCEYLIKT